MADLSFISSKQVKQTLAAVLAVIGIVSAVLVSYGKAEAWVRETAAKEAQDTVGKDLRALRQDVTAIKQDVSAVRCTVKAQATNDTIGLLDCLAQGK